MISFLGLFGEEEKVENVQEDVNLILVLKMNAQWINNEVLPYSTGKYIQSLWVEHDGKYYEKKNVYMYV